MLTGIAPANKPGLPTDSAAVVQQFVRNAKPLLDSLTALHFARLKIGKLQTQLTERESQRDGLATTYIQAQQQIGNIQIELFNTKEQLGRYRRKYRASQFQLWALRLGAGYLLYKKFCPSCRP
ncbi:hypothetical protein [Spirosoma oryzicola]|uniref:hypothetical protein n=1 Tax=Spirosoma oryzicola TaxID=2898794 RepID=UPI001E5D0CC4|nr:hypothetical protein [Spirosoma oryzicola]UHG93400.1 hypothetical protein LQ777_10955 [Spirosoma oryzicola]